MIKFLTASLSGAIRSKQVSINGMNEGVEYICFQAFLSQLLSLLPKGTAKRKSVAFLAYFFPYAG